jgi:hypothetical protein
MLKFNHGLFDIKEACGLTDEDIKNFFAEVKKANEEAESLSQFVEKIENIVLNDEIYLRCAMFHIVTR